ncbi:MAG: GNAT family N-acetyltransferase [Solitalea-like symbiont of Tyrophagus putrescentiae]
MDFIKANNSHYTIIVDLWEQSVNETHKFLKQEDKESIKKEICTYLDKTNLLMWYKQNELIGFSGHLNKHIEMLFLYPNKFNQGYGTEIIKILINNFKIISVDVNKQNLQALNFYIKNGFKIISECAIDDMGRPYPILKLQLQHTKQSITT